MLKKQIFVFILIGICTVLLDYMVYRFLLYFTENSRIDNIYLEVFSKTTGFLAGTLFSYFANKYITFKSQSYKGKTLLKFIFLYATTLLINVVSNSISIFVLNQINLSNILFIEINMNINDIYLLAFLFATGISAILNFIGMKWFVFYNIKKY